MLLSIYLSSGKVTQGNAECGSLPRVSKGCKEVNLTCEKYLGPCSSVAPVQTQPSVPPESLPFLQIIIRATALCRFWCSAIKTYPAVRSKAKGMVHCVKYLPAGRAPMFPLLALIWLQKIPPIQI